MRRLAAWLVHLYTALGAVLGLLFVLAAVHGHVREAFLWSVAAMFVDGTDGTLARAVDVKRVVPEFDGALLDNVVDYLTYVLAPVVLLVAGGYLPDGAWGKVVAGVVLVASCYQFCRTDAKTDDHLFLGFPSYWNVVALYVVVLGLGHVGTTVALLVCAALVPVPIGYLYPSRTTAFRRSGFVLTLLYAVAFLVLVLQLPHASVALAWVSLLYVAWYVAVSLLLTGRRRAARP